MIAPAPDWFADIWQEFRDGMRTWKGGPPPRQYWKTPKARKPRRPRKPSIKTLIEAAERERQERHQRHHA